MMSQRWSVGEYTVTSVVEAETTKVPPELFFPAATAQALARHEWLVPDFADARGRMSFRVQALIVEGLGRRIVIDPCVGNGKKRSLPFWNEQTYPFLERFRDAGFSETSVDTVIHTHLHADHVGWDTQLRGGAWVPTFERARHLYTARALEWMTTRADPDAPAVYADSIQPIVVAGLSDIVDEDADLGRGLRLCSTPGHTPGHVSLWIESGGETALVSGDFIHHPVQCAEPHWAEIADEDAEAGRVTRRRMLEEAARVGALFIGTHFPARPAGRIRRDGGAFRFVPV